MKIITLFDANRHGHHPTYQKLIAKMLLEEGHRVWLFCSGVEDVLAWLEDRCTADMMSRLVTEPVSPIPEGGFFQKRFRGIHTWKYASNKIREIARTQQSSPDLVIFLKVDDFAKGILTDTWIDRIFPFRWSGIYIHLRFPEKYKMTFVRQRYYQPFSLFRSKRLNTIGILQEDAVDRLEQLTLKAVTLLPDITDESVPIEGRLARAIIEKAHGRRIIGLIGGQDRRKGSFLFLEIARSCRDRNWLFVFAGKMNYEYSDRQLEELKKSIRNDDDDFNCFFHFERIPEEGEFNAIVKLCDVIFAVYRNFPFSSNIMTKAVLYHKPLVVSADNLMAHRVNKYGLGSTCNYEDVDDCIQAIQKVIDNPPSAENFQNFYQLHSKDLFLKRFKFLIEKSLC